jgi:hypothetical protein
MPEEIRFLGRSALFGIVLGTIYWFVAYEPAGTILLVGFGVAGALIAVGLAVRARSRGVLPGGQSPLGWFLFGPEDDRSPFGEDPDRLPNVTSAPLFIGIGFALAALALAFGPWFLLAAAPPIAVGGWSWIAAIVAEHRAVARADGSDEG